MQRFRTGSIQSYSVTTLYSEKIYKHTQKKALIVDSHRLNKHKYSFLLTGGRHDIMSQSSFEMSETNYPVTQSHVAEEQSPNVQP
jgi:hypothetical protein